MKNKRHIKSFNEASENLNISDVISSKLIKSAKVMTDDEIKNAENSQKYNIEKFKDIFDKINEVSNFKFVNEDEKNGAIKSLNILKNYILNRDVD